MLRMIYVTPDGGHHWVDSEWRDTKTLRAAIDDSQPGDLIRLLPGNYFLPEAIDLPCDGTAAEPIIIRGEHGAIIDGRRPPDPEVSATSPGATRYAAFRMVNRCHIRLDNIRIERCWPSAVYMENSHHLTFKDMQIVGGTYAFYADGPACRHLTIVRCDWVQDDSLWRYINWAMVHDGELVPGEKAPYRYLNGAFFGSNNIAGDVVIRGNDIRHCYNAIRLDLSDENQDAPLGQFNCNVVISNNRFSFVRDNPVEPETVAVNWWVFNNQLYNCHKWFSQDGVRGGFWYYFGNRGWFDSRPGPEGDENNGGAVFKFGKDPDALPTLPFECFHNSFYLRQQYVKKGTTRNWRHRRNVLGYADSAELPPGLMTPGQPFLGEDLVLSAADNVSFDGDLCNHPTFPEIFENYPGVYLGGTRANGPVFRAGICGDLALVPGKAEPFAQPLAVEMPDGTVWHSANGLMPGALDGNGLFDGPKYRPIDRDYLQQCLGDDHNDA
ncbi:hypothetical protein [Thalassospira sp. NFXS8]|uniref:hypothetical protein n=1 Tax=Thalassospira sp. NFXS8 TaxID=2819093 RepID=UPI0032DE577A